jgi:hypothetical protein
MVKLYYLVAVRGSVLELRAGVFAFGSRIFLRGGPGSRIFELGRQRLSCSNVEVPINLKSLSAAMGPLNHFFPLVEWVVCYE